MTNYCFKCNKRTNRRYYPIGLIPAIHYYACDEHIEEARALCDEQQRLHIKELEAFNKQLCDAVAKGKAEAKGAVKHGKSGKSSNPQSQNYTIILPNSPKNTREVNKHGE